MSCLVFISIKCVIVEKFAFTECQFIVRTTIETRVLGTTAGPEATFDAASLCEFTGAVLQIETSLFLQPCMSRAKLKNSIDVRVV